MDTILDDKLRINFDVSLQMMNFVNKYYKNWFEIGL